MDSTTDKEYKDYPKWTASHGPSYFRPFLPCGEGSKHAHTSEHANDMYERIKNKRRDVAVADKPAWFVL